MTDSRSEFEELDCVETELANIQPARIEIQGVPKSYNNQRGSVVALDNVCRKFGVGEFPRLADRIPFPRGSASSTQLWAESVN